MVKIISHCSLILLVFLMICSSSYTQSKPVPKTFPAFNLKLTDSKIFKSSSVKKGEPVMVIYFSPTCDHCKNFIDTLLKNMKDFKHCTIILVTYVDITEVKQFENDYRLKNYKNIIAGTEGNDFTVRFFYDVGTFPFIAVYNKNLMLDAIYRKPPPMEKLKQL